MGKIRTVLCDISKDELGFTYTHEHLYCVPPKVQLDRDFELSDKERSLKELRTFASIGGKSLVEGSTIDYGRDATAMKWMSQESGVHVVATSGFNKHIYFPDWVNEKSIDEISEMLIKEITVGIDGTNIRAGQLKAGSWYNVIHPLEEKVTRAVAIAHKDTNAPIWLHTEAGTMALEMLDILEEYEVDLSNVVVGHMDRNPDYYYFKKILDRGASVGFDGPSKVKYHPDNIRVDLIKRLVEEGYIKQITISGDMGRQSYLHAYGGGPGFNFIKNKFIPRLIEEGLTEADIEQIFVVNPREWLGKF